MTHQAVPPRGARIPLGSLPLSSSSGTQQGDPLAGLLWSLAHAQLWRRFTASMDPASFTPSLPPTSPTLSVWYVDDGTLAAHWSYLRAAFSFLLSEGAAHGFHVNPAKCEIICHISATSSARALFPELPEHNFRTFSDWELLGAHVGSSQSAYDAFATTRIEKAIRKTRVIACVPDSHIAATLLRLCGSGCLITHLSRCSGPTPAMATFDDAVFAAFVRIHPGTGHACRAQFELPLRFGGHGLRPSARTSPLAFIASVAESAPLIATLSRDLVLAVLGVDCRVVSALSDPLLAPHPDVLFEMRRHLQERLPEKKLQHDWSSLIDTHLLESLCSSLDERGRARICSLCTPHASDYLTPVSEDDADDFHQWLTSAQYIAVTLARYGCTVSTRLTCAMCHKRPAALAVPQSMDTHSWACNGAGGHMAAHHAFRDLTFQLCSLAGLHPQKEVQPFASAHRDRLDLVVPFVLAATARPEAVDTAIISPFALANVTLAASAPGAHVAAYESKKVDRYGAAASTSNVVLSPVIADFFGALSPSAHSFFLRVAAAWASRFDMPRVIVLRRCFVRVSASLQRSSASLLLANVATEDVPAG